MIVNFLVTATHVFINSIYELPILMQGCGFGATRSRMFLGGIGVGLL